MNKIMFSILKILEKQQKVLGSTEIARQLKPHGIELTERAVRYHLRILDERGLTKNFGKKGRRITEKGKKEFQHAFVSERVGFVISKIETLSFLADFNVDTLQGNAILNISYFPEDRLIESLQILKRVFNSQYVMSERVVMAKANEEIGDLLVPEGTVGLGTICSITMNGIFLSAGIPVISKFGGVIEIENGRPKRFVSIINYDGSSLDPLEIFIKSKMTDVLGVIMHNSGKILASFREIPSVCVDKAETLIEKMVHAGIGGVILLGKPNQSLLGIPVGLDRVGIIVVGGLNPIAALEEANIPSESHAMSAIYQYSKLMGFENMYKKISKKFD